MTRGPLADWETRLLILDDIEDHPGTSSGHIARRLGRSIHTIRYHLTRLERDHLIERRPAKGANVRIWPRYDDPPHTPGDT